MSKGNKDNNPEGRKEKIFIKLEQQLFDFTVSFKSIAELFNYILDGCETIDEARQKIKVFSEFDVSLEKNSDGDRQREQTRNRVKRYRERQKTRTGTDKRKCAYCGEDATEIDHLIPISKGGNNSPENLVPACKTCNRSKNNKDLSEFLNMSLNDKYLKVNHKLVQNNSKIMNIVSFNGEIYTMK